MVLLGSFWAPWDPVGEPSRVPEVTPRSPWGALGHTLWSSWVALRHLGARGTSLGTLEAKARGKKTHFSRLSRTALAASRGKSPGKKGFPRFSATAWVAFGHLGTLWESPRGSLKSLQDHLGGTQWGQPQVVLGGFSHTLGPCGRAPGDP